MVQNLIPNLNSKTGRLYRDVVDCYIFAREDLSGQEAGRLMEYVVSSLKVFVYTIVDQNGK